MGKSTSWAPQQGELSRRPAAVTEGYKPSRFRSFFVRLRTAWLVLIGRIDPDAITKAQTVLNMPMQVVHTATSTLRLRSSWWAHGPDLTHARDMVRRELCDAAAPYILYQDLPTEDGGYQVTGELLICKEATP
jgi:hypothetical protein